MTIQVWFDNHPVGMLKNTPTDRAEISILMMTESISKHGPDTADMPDIVWIQTAERHRRIADEQLMTLGHLGVTGWRANTDALKRHFDVPAYAVCHKRTEDMSIVFTWRVATPTLDQYETMFDLDTFEPL